MNSKKIRKRYPKELLETKIRKQIDWTKTLENYEQRISICRREFFLDLHEAYVSDYNLHRSYPEGREKKSHIPILMKMAARHENIRILGAVSANRKNGEYMYLPKEIPKNAKIVYVGKENFITGKPESRYSIRRKDIVFFKFTSNP